MMSVRRFLFGILVAALLSVCGGLLSCKDMNGNDVDWYYVYKVPRESSNPNPLIKTGFAHYYLDDSSPNFKLSSVSLENKSQAVAQTLQQVYDLRDQIAYVMYNDHWPNGRKTSSRGHTKGVLAFDNQTGFWLIHSVPMFPSNKSYSWPENAVVYGQSMICVTFKSSEMAEIGEQMRFTYPYIYDYKLPSELSQLVPSLQGVVKGDHVESPPWMQKVSLYSQNGQQFTHYAKSREFNQDLYFDWMAPDMKTGLQTETWQNGRGKLRSNCSSDYHVLNIKMMKFPDVNFPSTRDHSKLAMTNSSLQVICVGDINRMLAQYKRGGGTMCLNSSDVWEQYQKIVSDVEQCQGTL
ncbi:plancitoxin-1-like [Apostichopus japonicus]|uniref:plancitoxin-1-like n=1 Tax=Stichopus japonicus TaxID=307972 RepID=UPI003AB35E2F